MHHLFCGSSRAWEVFLEKNELAFSHSPVLAALPSGCAPSLAPQRVLNSWLSSSVPFCPQAGASLRYLQPLGFPLSRL